jgi:hypothetical protein
LGFFWTADEQLKWVVPHKIASLEFKFCPTKNTILDTVQSDQIRSSGTYLHCTAVKKHHHFSHGSISQSQSSLELSIQAAALFKEKKPAWYFREHFRNFWHTTGLCAWSYNCILLEQCWRAAGLQLDWVTLSHEIFFIFSLNFKHILHMTRI